MPTKPLDAGEAVFDLSANLKKFGGDLNKARGMATSMASGIGGTLTKVLGLGIAGASALVVGGLSMMAAKGIAVFKPFESQMAILKTAAGDTSATMEQLSEAALKVGEDTSLVAVSATGAADAVTGLLKAGLSLTDVFGDLNGYMNGTVELGGALRASFDLAAASELNAAAAADVITSSVSSYHIAVEDASSITDLFVKAADAGVASVPSLVQGLANVGPAAYGMGLSLEETLIPLSLLNDNFVVGAEAGTGLRSILNHISKDSSKVTQTLDDMGVAVFDNTGTMRDLKDIFEDMRIAMSSMTDAQRLHTVQILGGIGGQVALNILVDQGAAGFERMEQKIANASTAQEVAAARADTLEGALESLDGVAETLWIRIGKGLEPAMRSIIRTATEVLEKAAPTIVKIFQLFGVALQAIADEIQEWTGDAEEWGRNFGNELVDGIASTIPYLVAVVKTIGAILKFLLGPGSPPRIAPDIDQWGRAAMEEYFKGFTTADLGILSRFGNDVQAVLQQFFEAGDLEETQILPLLDRIQHTMGEVIQEAEEMGEITPEMLQRIAAAAGPAGEQVSELAKSYLELRVAAAKVIALEDDLAAADEDVVKAQKEVARVEAEITRIREDALRPTEAMVDLEDQLAELNEELSTAQDLVTEASRRATEAQRELTDISREYAAELSPLQTELSGVRDQLQELRDAEETARLEKIISDTQSTDIEKQKAALKLQEMQLRSLISAKEEEQAQAEAAAKANLQQARVDQELAQRAVEDIQWEQDSAQEQLDFLKKAAIEKANVETKALEDDKTAAEARLQTFVEQRDAIKEQLDLAKDRQKVAGEALGALRAQSSAISNQMKLYKDQRSLLDRIKLAAEGVGRAFGGIAKLAEDAVEPIKDVKSAMDETLADLKKKIEEALDFEVPELDLEALGLDNIDELANELSKEWMEALQPMLDFFKDNGPLIKDTLLGLTVVFGAAGILGTITKVAGAFAILIGPGKAIIAIIAKIVSALLSLNPIVLAIIAAIALLALAWKKNWFGIRDILTKFWDETLQPFFEKVGMLFLFGLPLIWVAVMAKAKEVWTGIETFLAETWDMIHETAVEIWDAIYTWIEETILGIQTTITETVTSIKTFWEDTWTAIKDKAQEIWDLIRIIIVTALILLLGVFGIKLEDLLAKWKEIWDDVSTKATEIWEEIKTLVKKAMQKVYDFVQTKIDELKTFWSRRWGEIKTKANELWEEIKTLIADAIQAVYDSVQTKIDEIETYWGDVWDAIWTKASEIWEDIKTVVANAISAILTGLNEKAEELKTAATKPLSDAWTAISNTLGDWLQLGKDLIQGMVDGVKAKAQALIDAAVGVVSDAVARAKALLGIGSPSKVFMKFGNSISEGLAQGVLQSSYEIQDALRHTLQLGGLGTAGDTISSSSATTFNVSVPAPLGSIDDLRDMLRLMEMAHT